jgi:hypothetical protein
MTGTKENPGQVVHIQGAEQDSQATASIQRSNLFPGKGIECAGQVTACGPRDGHAENELLYLLQCKQLVRALRTPTDNGGYGGAKEGAAHHPSDGTAEARGPRDALPAPP